MTTATPPAQPGDVEKARATFYSVCAAHARSKMIEGAAVFTPSDEIAIWATALSEARRSGEEEERKAVRRWLHARAIASHEHGGAIAILAGCIAAGDHHPAKAPQP